MTQLNDPLTLESHASEGLPLSHVNTSALPSLLFQRRAHSFGDSAIDRDGEGGGGRRWCHWSGCHPCKPSPGTQRKEVCCLYMLHCFQLLILFVVKFTYLMLLPKLLEAADHRASVALKESMAEEKEQALA